MSVSLPGRRGGRRVDVELNLVPYIDLLTCMIAFLLITAVWTQVDRLRVSRRGDGDDVVTPGIKMTVVVSAEGLNLVVGDERQIFPRRLGVYDFAALTTALERVKRAHPDKDDALVASEDRIQYETLVGAMDAVLSAGFPAVSLVEAGGR
jgi:biopolymer transport protein TolR